MNESRWRVRSAIAPESRDSSNAITSQDSLGERVHQRPGNHSDAYSSAQSAQRRAAAKQQTGLRIMNRSQLRNMIESGRAVALDCCAIGKSIEKDDPIGQLFTNDMLNKSVILKKIWEAKDRSPSRKSAPENARRIHRRQ